MQKIKTYIQTHKKLSILAGIILLAVIVISFKSSSTQAETITVSKGDVKEQVIVTGNIKPAQDVDLAFEKVGKVRSVSVDVGSVVTTGQVLVALDSGETYADYLKAQANVATEQANLDELKRGTRPEELTIAETEVSNARTNAENAADKLKVALYESYTNSDDVIHNSVDQLFSNARTSNPQINISIDNTQLKNDINQSRFAIETLLSGWNTTSTDISRDRIVDTYTKLNTIKVFLDKVASAVNSLTANANMTQTTVDAYKASISSARATIIATQNSLASAEDKVNTTKGALLVAEQNYQLKKAGTTPEAIRAQEARVLQAQGTLQAVSAQLDKMTLRAPFAGVVTKQDAKVGAIVGANTPVVSLISNTKLEIEANVSEINIGKIQVGNSVDITMDAFPGKVFTGTVSYIDPGETLVDGVVNFKVTVVFTQEYPELKTGLSANLTINTKQALGVLKVPTYAIVKKDEGSFVTRRIDSKKTEEVKVETGLSGTDGFVEIKNGLQEGDIVVLEAKK
jgi:HlyD family secretion protein